MGNCKDCGAITKNSIEIVKNKKYNICNKCLEKRKEKDKEIKEKILNSSHF